MYYAGKHFYAFVRFVAVGRKRRQKAQTELFTGKSPGLSAADVIQQRLVVVFRCDADVYNAAVDKIAQNKIYKTVTSAKRNCSHTAQTGKFAKVGVGV